MSRYNLFSSKLVRKYQNSDHELTVSIFNESGTLLALGRCVNLNGFPTITFANYCLTLSIYGYEFRRWLNLALSWCADDKILANFESDETLFDADFLD